jgi:DNA mismatch repair protein MutL
MAIQILDSQLVSKIAAGEVVERPASVVKELVENSLDAGASSITVETRGGGVNLVRVTDNGSGISEKEVELAFSRHATSKLLSLGDMEKIATLGFRGEALPSIASVADVEMLTRADSDKAGSYLRLANGTVVYREKRSRPGGTTVTVHNLFRHFPARLKFLKSTSTENSHIANLVTHYALGFPGVKFNLSIDGRSTLQTSGNGNLTDVIATIYSIDVAGQMLPVEGTEQSVTVSGMVSPVSLSRSNRNYMSFFINHRWIRNSLLIRAAEDAYHGMLMTGKHPVTILNISLPLHEVDVNVHPTKAEVKFRNNNQVYTAIRHAVRNVLGAAPVPEVKTGAPPSPKLTQPVLWSTESSGSHTAPASAPAGVPHGEKGRGSNVLPVLRVVGQLSSCYIMAEGPDGLYLIDQHAAHERILFEKVLAQRAEREVEIQGLLEPTMVELSPKQEEILKLREPLLKEFGLNLEHFGGRSYILRAVPALWKEGDPGETVRSLLDSLISEEDPLKREEKIAYTIACHSAIKAGDSLTVEEMRELIKQLEEAAQPRSCPHGRPTMIHLSSHQLAKEFGRLG